MLPGAEPGEDVSAVFRLSDVGTEPLTRGGWEHPSTEISVDRIEAGQILQPGEEAVGLLRWTPRDSGPFDSWIDFLSEDPDEPRRCLLLEGNRPGLTIGDRLSDESWIASEHRAEDPDVAIGGCSAWMSRRGPDASAGAGLHFRLPPPGPAMSPFAHFCDAYHRHFTRDPNSCVFLGVDERLDDLPDPSEQEEAASVAEAEALLASLAQIETGTLSFEEALDAELAELALRRQIFEARYLVGGGTRAQKMPRAADSIGDGVFTMITTDPRPAAERLGNICSRIEQIPAFLRAQLARLDLPVQRWVDVDVAKVNALPSLLDTVRSWAKEERWEGAARLEVACASARKALTSYVTDLAALPSCADIHLGPEAAQQIVHLRGIDKGLDELHAIARSFLAETRTLLHELRDRLAMKYELPADIPLADLHRFLNERYRVALPNDELADILQRYEEERRSLLAFIEARDLFPIFPEQDMLILRTPKFMEPSIPAGAMMPPASFREGPRTSIVYLTLRRDLLDEHTEIGIPVMMIHEGIPGHHLQLATASRHPSIIRRHADTAEHAEGWTTMLEDYMLDLGYMGELTDEARFVGKRDLSRIGARVAIDLFFMSGEKRYLDVGVDADTSSDDPFVAAGALLQAVTGFTDGRVQAELNWYSQERGYPLSYLAGNRQVWDLKERVARAQAGKLEGLDLDRRFHRLYLESGNMPLRFLERVFAHEGLL